MMNGHVTCTVSLCPSHVTSNARTTAERGEKRLVTVVQSGVAPQIKRVAP